MYRCWVTIMKERLGLDRTPFFSIESSISTDWSNVNLLNSSRSPKVSPKCYLSAARQIFPTWGLSWYESWSHCTTWMRNGLRQRVKPACDRSTSVSAECAAHPKNDPLTLPPRRAPVTTERNAHWTLKSLINLIFFNVIGWKWVNST